MRRRICAIAWITMRSTLRSPPAWALVGLLGAILALIPWSLEGDGTLAGRVQLQLTYGLGLAFLVLNAATGWASSGAVSRDVASRVVYTVVTKPVRPAEIWFGKWLGLMGLNALLLGVCGAILGCSIRWGVGTADGAAPDRWEIDESILAARRVVRPTHPELADRARRSLDADPDATSPVTQLEGQQGLRGMEESSLQRHYAAAAGETIEWRFDLPILPPPNRSLFLAFRLDTSLLDAGVVDAAWRIGGNDSRAVVTRTGLAQPGRHTILPIPPETVSTDRRLTVRFTPRVRERITVLFDPDGGLKLYVYAGSFEANLIRTLAILWCQLGLVGAVGVTAGCLFSWPVAALLTFNAAVILYAGPALAASVDHAPVGAAGGDPVGGAMLRGWSRGVFGALRIVLAPLDRPDPIQALARAEWVSLGEVAAVFLAYIIIYGGAVAGMGCAAFGRREVGAAA